MNLRASVLELHPVHSQFGVAVHFPMSVVGSICAQRVSNLCPTYVQRVSKLCPSCVQLVSHVCPTYPQPRSTSGVRRLSMFHVGNVCMSTPTLNAHRSNPMHCSARQACTCPRSTTGQCLGHGSSNTCGSKGTLDHRITHQTLNFAQSRAKHLSHAQIRPTTLGKHIATPAR